MYRSKLPRRIDLCPYPLQGKTSTRLATPTSPVCTITLAQWKSEMLVSKCFPNCQLMLTRLFPVGIAYALVPKLY